MSELTIPAMFERAKQAVAANELDEANDLLLKVVSADPQNEEAWLLLSEVAPEVRQSIACLERVLALNPDNAQAKAWLELALAADSSGESSVTRGVDDKRPVPPLGHYLVSLGLVDAKAVQLALQVQAEAERTGVRRSIGEILIAQGRLTQAQLDMALREQLRDVYSLFVD